MKRISLSLSAVIMLTAAVLAVAAPATAAELSAEESHRLGEAMYQKGVLPSGKPLKAFVQGDIEVTGKMTTCANCHRRSGLGSLEGGVLTPPTNGAKLYAPLTGQQSIPGSVMKRAMFKTPRPAYTDETLVNALLLGVGPTGNKLSDTMPRYAMDEEAARIMISYLRGLSSQVSPGVTAEEIRFATIVTETVPPADREAMLLPLQAYLREEWNGRLSIVSSQWNTRWNGTANGPGNAANAYRKAALDVWELKGPSETWNTQLEAYYRQKPVFAILGGMAPGKWAPIHQFCEKHGVPDILPITDLPTVSTTDVYTLYFSKGLFQEGEAAAKYLSRVFDLPPDKKIVQVFHDNDEGNAFARGFGETWKKLGNAPLTNRTLRPSEKVAPTFWKDLSASNPNSVIVAWVHPEALTGIESIADGGTRASTLVVSGTMLGKDIGAIPDKIRDFTFITYPNRLPEDADYTKTLVLSWMKMKKVPVTNLEISSKIYLLTRLLSNVLLDMGNDLYRDFFLDLLDDSVDQVNSSLSYPVLSFGPGQRYAAKGCYIVTLGKGAQGKLIRQSEWIIY